ncbi:GNAT family N-acetyltransferase [Planctomycetes bacterium TBK1r]|uniref:N-acetyltransferase domain-containing protein n=1 Tax=Stieleria magnilauensis TaxID=2527963 RepID=A0ABX5XKU0_9BACT|nr:hypothetical protein TBK1r_01710 [Planctomycetes bacterium TBK1r]
MPFRIEKLAKHDRSEFDCGTEALNRYLQRQAGQDQRKRYAVCFVAVDDDSEAVSGFYTLSSGSLDLDRLPTSLSQKLPRYQVVPVVVMGRLAVAKSAQGVGLAQALLFDATKKVATLNVGAFALLVVDGGHALNHYGGVADSGRHSSMTVLSGDTSAGVAKILEELE